MNTKMNYQFSEGVENIPVSFIREILKVASQPEVISFAGGLPNADYFPAEAIMNAARTVLERDAKSALQYNITEGYLPLREFISHRYKLKQGLDIPPEEILITNGSQQALDLVAKIFINKGDGVLLEKPSYLGAIQCFSAYQPNFHLVNLLSDGIDTSEYQRIMNKFPVKLFYSIPNYQNPTGISYSLEKRNMVANETQKHATLIVEDDPYSEINFTGEKLPLLKRILPEQTILLGSFSKVISPGLRMGWVVAKKEIMKKLVLAKQASDLHSNFLTQKIIYEYLNQNDFDFHIGTIVKAYRDRKDYMLKMIHQYFPKGIKVTNPSGGMFLWVTLPVGTSATRLLEKAAEEKVIFVPGRSFYTDNLGDNSFRLNFSNAGFNDIKAGIKRLGAVIEEDLRS